MLLFFLRLSSLSLHHFCLVISQSLLQLHNIQPPRTPRKVHAQPTRKQPPKLARLQPSLMQKRKSANGNNASHKRVSAPHSWRMSMSVHFGPAYGSSLKRTCVVSLMSMRSHSPSSCICSRHSHMRTRTHSLVRRHTARNMMSRVCFERSNSQMFYHCSPARMCMLPHLCSCRLRQSLRHSAFLRLQHQDRQFPFRRLLCVRSLLCPTHFPANIQRHKRTSALVRILSATAPRRQRQRHTWAHAQSKVIHPYARSASIIRVYWAGVHGM
jgi:hypothetical protein